MKPDDTYDNHTCHDKCQRIACVLRRELIAMIKQRDRLRECIAELEDERDRLRKIVDEQCRFSSVCCEYREQRDEARRLAEKYRYLSCDSQDEADETLLPWETTKPNEL